MKCNKQWDESATKWNEYEIQLSENAMKWNERKIQWNENQNDMDLKIKWKCNWKASRLNYYNVYNKLNRIALTWMEIKMKIKCYEIWTKWKLDENQIKWHEKKLKWTW